MKAQAKHFWAMLALLVAGGALVNFWASAGEARVPRKPLAEFPRQVGAWSQSGPDQRFDAETEAVLRRFWRSDKIRNTPGVGLGLNLVSAIAKLHGFRLAIHPGPGGRIEIICPVIQQD